MALSLAAMPVVTASERPCCVQFVTLRARNHAEVRLDVIDSNPRARTLYEREGFNATDTHRLGLLRHVFGFESATTMIKTL